MRSIKRCLALALVVILAFMLCSCAKSTTLRISFTGSYKVVSVPDTFKNYSTREDDIFVTVKKDGEYPFVVKNDEGKELSFVLTFKNGSASIETTDDIQVTVSIEK